MGKRSAIVLCIAALAACNKVDSAKFEKSVQANLEAGGISGATVSCPKNVDAKKGVKFTCTVKIEDTSYDYDVEITDSHGSTFDTEGSFRKGVAFSSAKLIELLTPSIKEKIGTDPTIDCGKEPLLFGDEGQIHCSMTASGSTVKLRIDVDGSDLKGWQVEE